MCAFLAPDAIPESMFAQGATHLGPTLGLLETDPFLLDEALRVLRMYSLVRREATMGTENLLSVHRLVQTVLRDQMAKEADNVWKQRGRADCRCSQSRCARGEAVGCV
jgi:hypothetical protein